MNLSVDTRFVRLSTIWISWIIWSLHTPLAISLRSSQLHCEKAILIFQGKLLDPISLYSLITRIIRGFGLMFFSFRIKTSIIHGCSISSPCISFLIHSNSIVGGIILVQLLRSSHKSSIPLGNYQFCRELWTTPFPCLGSIRCMQIFLGISRSQ